MKDGDALLAARLAMAQGKVMPSDWLKVYEEHTDYEWACQVARCGVDPWGDAREDLRAAVNTARIIASQPGVSIDIEETINELRFYLKSSRPEDEKLLSPAMMRTIMGE